MAARGAGSSWQQVKMASRRTISPATVTSNYLRSARVNISPSVEATRPSLLTRVASMARKRPTAAGKRVKLAAHWGMYVLMGALLTAMASGATAQLLAASPSPDPAVAAAASTASRAANLAGASNAAAASSSARTLYVYGDQLRPLVEVTDGVQTLNIYGPGGQIIAQVVRDGQGNEEARYLLTDHLGSTRVVLDADGNAVARFEYGPYGETTAEGTAAAGVHYRYTGHPYDEARGVYETPGRGYDPTTGRFLSVDPQRSDASPYAYAGNNPMGFLDPTGDIRYPFFVVTEDMASTERQQTEAILELFGGPPQGTAAGMTTPTDLARIETRGNNLDALPNARQLLTERGANIDRSRAIIFVTEQTTPDAVRNVTEGMHRLRSLSREAGEPAGSLFEDITIISRHANKRMGQSLFESLDARGFPRVRMFVQSFNVLRPTTINPNHEVYSVAVSGSNRPELQASSSLGPWVASLKREEYVQRMEVNFPPVPGRRSHGYASGIYRPLEPQLETPRPLLPRRQLQLQIETQIELVIPRGNQPVLPNFPEAS